jgi:hypothetical protein
MKKILICLLLAISTASFASTNVQVSPVNPVNCATQNANQVNWIYQVEKTLEDSDSVTFTFITKFGACIDQKISTQEIRIMKGNLVLLHDGLNLPFSKSGVVSNIQHYAANDEAKVTLTFDKNRLFKRKSVRTYSMTFNPFAQSRVYFGWNISLTQNANHEVQMLIAK